MIDEDARVPRGVRSSSRRAALLGLVLALQGCGVIYARPACFSDRPEIELPQPDRHVDRITNGQAGRDLALAVQSGAIEDAIARLRGDPRLADTHIPAVPYPDFAPAGAYGNLLTFAVGRCDMAMIDALLGAGVKPDVGLPGMPLFLALLADTPEMADRLLRGGAMTNPETIGGRSHVNDMAVIGNLGAMRMLDRYGARLDDANELGFTPLWTALGQAHWGVARFLFDRGASLWSIGMDGRMPAHHLPAEDAAMSSEERALLAPLFAERANVGGPLIEPHVAQQALAAGRWPVAPYDRLGAPRPTPELIALAEQDIDSARRRGLE